MPKTMPDEVLEERLSEIKAEVTTKALSAERLMKIKNLSRTVRLLCLMYQVIIVLLMAFAIKEYWSAITSPEALMNAFVKPLYWLAGLALMQGTLKAGSEPLFTPMFGRRVRWLGQWIIVAAPLASLEGLLSPSTDQTAFIASKMADVLISLSWGKVPTHAIILGIFFSILGLMMEEAAKLKAENDLVV